MSNVNNQFKELINEAIHNHFHDKTETEMILKDWLYGICEQLDEYEAKAKAFDEIREARKEVLTDVRERGLKLPADLDKFSMMTERIIKKYESGESE